MESVQRCLWNENEKFLGSVERLDVEYAPMLKNPTDVVYEVIECLGISPSNDQISRALQNVDTKLPNVGISNSTSRCTELKSRNSATTQVSGSIRALATTFFRHPFLWPVRSYLLRFRSDSPKEGVLPRLCLTMIDRELLAQQNRAP